MSKIVETTRAVPGAGPIDSPSHATMSTPSGPSDRESDAFVDADESSGVSESRADDAAAAIAFLRGEDNPFDIFVAAQSADDDFFCFHAPEIHAEAQAKIRRAIEKYTKPDYRSRRQLYPTRALLVRGARGAGKTHLLHAIQFRDDGVHDLLVRPRYFEKQYPFAEYVLKEVVRTLLGGDESDPPSPLRHAAGRIARRLLLETVLSSNPHDWLERTARPGTLGILLGRRWTKHQMRKQQLLRELIDNTADQVGAICERNRLEVDTARAMVSAHVTRCEAGTRPMARMRRQLLLAMFELGLSGRLEPLTTFLESGFAETGDGLAPIRASLVDDLLRTVVEILAAVGVPVVIAFDNIERLLAPVGRLDEQGAQAFFSGVAQLIDGLHGILVLLFVEDGLWIQCAQRAIDSFARDRMLLGVRMRDYGHVAELQLGPATYQAIDAIVRRRMAPLRARIDRADRLPALFPFSSDDLRAIAGHSSDVLRAALLRLRDRYDQLVLSGLGVPAMPRVAPEPSGAASQPTEPAVAEQVSQIQVERELLQPRWDSSVARAMRRLETTPLGSLAGELHAGLGRWLESFVDSDRSVEPIVLDGVAFRLLRVDAGITFGDHPTFGLMTVGHWQRASGGDVRRVGIGLVLAMGSGMPRDLAVKLSVLKVRPAPADELVVFWPDRDATFQPSDLPTASRKVWDEHAELGSVVLCGLPVADLAWLLAFNDWANEVAELAQPGWPDGATRQFLLARTRGLMECLAPNGER